MVQIADLNLIHFPESADNSMSYQTCSYACLHASVTVFVVEYIHSSIQV